MKPKVSVTHPDGSKTLQDGGIQEPSGLVFNKDGTQRLPIKTTINGVATTINPDGTTTPNQPGVPLRPGTTTARSPSPQPGSTSTAAQTIPDPLRASDPDPRQDQHGRHDRSGRQRHHDDAGPGRWRRRQGRLDQDRRRVRSSTPTGRPEPQQELPGGSGSRPGREQHAPGRRQGPGDVQGQGRQGRHPPAGDGRPAGPARYSPASPARRASRGSGDAECVPGTPGAGDPACAETQKKPPQVCTPDPATGVCPAAPDPKTKTGTSTEGSSTSGTGTGSGQRDERRRER